LDAVNYEANATGSVRVSLQIKLAVPMTLTLILILTFRNIELRGQYCLATSTFPIQCRSLMKLVKDLTQEFVDNTACNTEAVILVPFQPKKMDKVPVTIPPSNVNVNNLILIFKVWL